MDPGGMLLEDFGQRVDLTRRIREGTTALRELIQNADDAGASRVRLCLDRRTHGASSLLAPALAQWQGPALLAHNDAAFTDEDFQSTTGCRSSPIQASAALLRLLHLLPLQAEDNPATKL